MIKILKGFFVILGASKISSILPDGFRLYKNLIIQPDIGKEIRNLYGNGWVIITDASTGLGVKFTKTFSKLGYNVCLISKDEEKSIILGEKIKGKFKNEVIVINHDFGEICKESIKNLETKLNFGKISVLINNCQSFDESKYRFEEVPLEKILKSINVNFMSQIIMYKLMLKNLKSQINNSVIIDVCPIDSDFDYNRSNLVYQASKNGVSKLSSLIYKQNNMENLLTKRRNYKYEIFILKPFIHKYSSNQLSYFIESDRKIVDSTLRCLNKNAFYSYGPLRHEIFSFIINNIPINCRIKYFDLPFYKQTTKNQV